MIDHAFSILNPSKTSAATYCFTYLTPSNVAEHLSLSTREIEETQCDAMRLTACFIDRMVEYLVVTMHRAHLSLKLRLLPVSFFKCQLLPFLKRSFKSIHPGNPIIRNQVSPSAILP